MGGGAIGTSEPIDSKWIDASVAAPTVGNMVLVADNIEHAPSFPAICEELRRLQAAGTLEQFMHALFKPGACSESSPKFDCIDGQAIAQITAHHDMLMTMGAALRHDEALRNAVIGALKSNEDLPESVVAVASLLLDPAQRETHLRTASAKAAATANAYVGKKRHLTPPEAQRSADPSLAAAAHAAHARQTASAAPQQSGKAKDTYTVLAGDYLKKIAHKELNNPDKWTEIYAENRDQIKAPQYIVEPEWVLKMPPRVDEPPRNSASEHAPSAGESLSVMAYNLYRDASLWPRIWAINQDRLDWDPKTNTRTLVQIGRALRLPEDLKHRLKA